MNRVILSGNLACDVDVKYTQTGKTLARTVIAVNKRTKKTEGSDNADFFDLEAWDKTADFMSKYLKKGSRILVEGRIVNDNYKDKNGVMKYGNKIIVDNVEFGESKKDSSQNREQPDDEDEGGFDADAPF